MDRLRPLPVTVFCALTLFIWGNRIWLAWTNPDDSVATKIMWSLPITCFVVAAAVLLVLLLTGADRGGAGFLSLVRWFALGTCVYWGIRLPLILVHQHDLPFKIVHSVLALVSVAAAVAALRSIGGRLGGLGDSGDAR